MTDTKEINPNNLDNWNQPQWEWNFKTVDDKSIEWNSQSVWWTDNLSISTNEANLSSDKQLDQKGKSIKWDNVNSNNSTPKSDNTQDSQQTITKQWSKINTKTILVWCGIFLFIFVLLVGISFYIVLNNPQSLSNLGISTENIKSILMIFSILLFGSLFFVWFGFTALNTYRFFANKWSSKWKYLAWMVVWFFVFIWAIWLGVVSYIKINWISDEKKYNTNDLIIAHLQVKKYENTTTLPYSRIYIWTPGLKLIAPAYFDLQLNESVFSKMIAWKEIVLGKLTVDCDNGQIITNNASDLSQQLFLNTPCLYIDKWTYNIKFTYSYFDKIQNINQTRTVTNAATINIETDYDFSSDDKSRTLNDNKNEIIIWTAPAKLVFNAQKIFTDLNIPNINIYRDIDGDGNIDKENKVSFTYYLEKPKLYNSYFSIPWLQLPGVWQIYYLMRYRVNAWDVPVCNIIYTKDDKKNNVYNVMINIDDKWTDIENYAFDIIDNKTDEVVDTMSSLKNNEEITFPNGKEYRIRWYFNTAEGKKWVCEGSTIDVSASYYNIIADISYMAPWWNKYLKFGEDKSYKQLSWDKIILWDTPTTLKVDITDIIPSISNPQIKLFVDNNLKNPIKTNEYVFSISEEWEHELTIQVDDNKRKTSSKKYTIAVEKQSLVWILKANKYVWFDPFTVEFDASISKLNDPTDEVVYFTWDFGDGEVRSNTSVWKIIHTYRFNSTTENWEYQPKVIIKTKKWISQEIPLDEKIIVKRAIKSFDIISINHPTQIAKVWDIMDFGIQADWQIKSISRDFGNGNTLNWPNREFSEVSNIYKKAWTYNIYVTIEYENSPPVTQNMKIVINE